MFFNKLISQFLLFLFFLIATANFAFSKGLPIELNQYGDKFTVTNTGECIIYKLKVRSVPPEKEGVANVFSRAVAEYTGLNSFSAVLGKIEEGGKIRFYKSELTNSDGKRLTDAYAIGSLRFEGSTCGECGLSILLEAD